MKKLILNDKDVREYSFKEVVLKKALRALIYNFSIQEVNDKISQIYFEEAAKSRSKYSKSYEEFYDNLSEAYDNINTKFFKSFRKKEIAGF